MRIFSEGLFNVMIIEIIALCSTDESFQKPSDKGT
jgi:hypothetical protein